MRFVMVLLLLAASAATLEAKVRSRTVEYQQGDAVLEGFLAFDDARQGRRPGVLVIHEWMGLNDYAKRRAEQLAGLGYVAFAADIYGKGVRPKDRKEAGALAGSFRKDRALLRARARAGLDLLAGLETVDPRRLAAIGYCFGGGAALELARSGAPLAAVVSFHGNLDTPNPTDASNIRGKVLVLHGADDPHVSKAHIDAFQAEMKAAALDWQMVFYGGAVHAFSNPEVGTDKASGAAYDPAADRRSWEAMRDFFVETLGN